VVLTGGSSRRLGFDKATVRIGAETLAARAARVLGAVCEPVVEVGPGHSGLPAVRENPPGSGPLAALVAGAGAMQDRSLGDRSLGEQMAVVLLGCDLVRVESPMLELLAAWDGAPTAVPLVGGEPQLVCARYGPDAIGVARELLAAGERSLRALLAAVDADLVAEEHWRVVAGRDAFADLDTPEDLARLGLHPPG
jgi:molybdenum cofactor guanylyltransferase